MLRKWLICGLALVAAGALAVDRPPERGGAKPPVAAAPNALSAEEQELAQRFVELEWPLLKYRDRTA